MYYSWIFMFHWSITKWNMSVSNQIKLKLLTHWGRVMHICVSKLTIIGSDNGLSPDWRQAIIWTNAGILSIGLSGTNFSEIVIKINAFSFKEMYLKMSSGKWRPSCLSLNVLNIHDVALYFAYLYLDLTASTPSWWWICRLEIRVQFSEWK